MKFIVYGGFLSFIFMIAGIPIFNPILVPFPLTWILGIFTFFLTLTIPFHFLKGEWEKEEKAKKS